MPQRLKSWFLTVPRLHGDAKDRGASKEQEQDGCDVRSVTIATSSTSLVPPEWEDATQVSTTSINNSRLVPLLEPMSPQQILCVSSTSTPPLPAPPPTDSDDKEVSVGADGSTAGVTVQLWDRAYDNLKQEEPKLVCAYEKILSEKLEGGLGATVPKSEPNIIQHNSDERRRQMARLTYAGLDRIEKEAKAKQGLGVAMDTVLSAKDIISSAIQAVPQAALPWTGICVALEVLGNPIIATEANRRGIDYVIQRMGWYWGLSSSLFKHHDNRRSELSGARRELENQFINLYKAFLAYQVKSVYSLYRNRGLVFLRDIVKLDNWDGDLNAIRNAENLFHQDSKAYTAQQTGLYLEYLVKNKMSEDDRQCIRDLRSTDPRDDKKRIEKTKGGLLPDSYQWILDNSGFQRWRDNPQSSLLWIKGDPGKGKTMLLCGIIDELERAIVASGQSHNLVYFFCQATDSRINNAIAILRGLIYLLVRQQPSLLSHMRKKYDDAGKSLFEDVNAWFALSGIFREMLENPNLKTTYLIIDALDECVSDSSSVAGLPSLLDFIVGISSGRVKWLLSSRNEAAIDKKLKCDERRIRLSLELKENAKQVSGAVDAFIDEKLAQLDVLQEHTLGPVRDILHKKSNGTFLWVALVVQELSKEGVESWHILQIVEELPSDLNGIYDRMLDSIKRHKRDAEFCRKILSAATVAYRPLHLTEIGSLSALLGQFLKSTEDVRKIVANCGSFLTIQDGQVFLVHQSAKEYLSQRTSTALFPNGMGMTHHGMAIRSLQIMFDTLRRDMYGLVAPGFPIENVRVPDVDPLAAARYACVYWIDHLYECLSNGNGKHAGVFQDSGIIDRFLREHYLHWLEALSLLGNMSHGVLSMARLEGLLEKQESQLSKLVYDARRFIQYHRAVIENYPMQIYISALLFSPTECLVRKQFKAEEPSWIDSKPIMDEQWSACLATLEGHKGMVGSVAWSSDGWLASGSYEWTVRIWDASTGQCVLTLEADSPVTSVAWSSDGQFASGSFDNTVKIWNAVTGQCVLTLEGHTGLVTSVTWSSDGRLASGSEDTTIKIWDTATRQCISTLKGHTGSVTSVIWSSDGRLASSSEDMTVKIWNTVASQCVSTLEGHSGWVNSVAWSSGDRLASGSEDKTVKIWNAVTGQCVSTLQGHSESVLSVAWSSNSQLASGSFDNTVKIWDVATGHYIPTLERHSGSVFSVAWSSGDRLASSSEDMTVKIWNAVTGQCLSTLKGHSKSVFSVAWSSGDRLASGSFDNTVKIWNAVTGQCVLTLEGHTDWVTSVAWSSGDRLASGSVDNTVKIWSAATGQCVSTLKGHSGSVFSVAWSGDSRLASGSEDKTVKIWNAVTGQCVLTLEGHTDWVTSVAWSSGDRLASGSDDNTVKIWNVATCQCVSTLEDYGYPVRSVAWSSDGRLISSSQPRYQTFGYGLKSGETWITFEGKDLLWLPKDYRPDAGSFAVLGRSVAIGCASGRVLLLKFLLYKA